MNSTAEPGNEKKSFEQQLADVAIATLVDRIKGLSKADRDDLYRCIEGDLSAPDEESRRELHTTVKEILSPDKGKSGVGIFASTEPMERPRGYTKWVLFISKKIRETREEKEMTQADLAMASGLQQSYISRLEGGKHSPSRRTLEKLANALQIEVGDLDPTKD